MTMQDPIADMLTHIRNAQKAGHTKVTMPASRMKERIARVLLEEGYIKAYNLTEGKKPELVVELKYFQNTPVIEEINRISRPGLRAYKPVNELPKVRGGLGIAIVSTSQGVLSSREAAKKGLGGEILCTVF